MSGGNGNASAYGAQGVRVSKLAMFSMISGILLPLLLAGLFVTATSSVLDFYLVIILLAGLIVTLGAGIVSAVRITISRGTLTGKAYAVFGILFPGMTLSFLLVCVFAAASRGGVSYRMTCGTNLAGIGKAMLIYANDYDDQLPKAGVETNRWTDSLGGHANARAWLSGQRGNAYRPGQDDENEKAGAVTTSSSLYLLVRYADVAPKSFVCKSEKKTRAFRPKDWLGRGDIKELTDLWDFGYFESRKKNQSRHVSYGYHHPFGKHVLTVYHEPDMAVAADRSPWFDQRVDRERRWSEFEPDIDPNTGNAEQGRKGNSLAHEGLGQNVLFLDSHVSFENRSYVGIKNDNIYTIQDTDDIRQNAKGRLPVPYDAEASSPRHRRDSVLLQENGQPSN